jgi:hypothetical protein
MGEKKEEISSVYCKSWEYFSWHRGFYPVLHPPSSVSLASELVGATHRPNLTEEITVARGGADVRGMKFGLGRGEKTPG